MVTIGYLKNLLKKSLIGLGIVRGASAKLKEVTPNVSPIDPDIVTSNDVTFRWDTTDPYPPLDVNPTWAEQTFRVVNGRGVYTMEYKAELSTAEFSYFLVTYDNGDTGEFKVPTSSGSLKKKVVEVLPPAATADKNAIYLVPIAGKPGSYEQWLCVEDEASGEWQWLSLGTTDVDLTLYQKKVDENIIKNYPNYDPATKAVEPNNKNVVGAINEHEKVIGATYDYTNSKVANLNTLHNNNIVDAVNEIGYLPDLEMYDTVTGTPDNLVDAINLANKNYSVDKNATVDRTKHVDSLKLDLDPKDGSPVVQVGDTIEIPRVDITQNAAAQKDAEFTDYRTYTVKMAGQDKDPNDASAVPFGSIHIPQIKIKRKVPTTTQTKTEVLSFATTDWIEISPNTHYQAIKTLSSLPYSFTSLTFSSNPPGYSMAHTVDQKVLTVDLTGTSVYPFAVNATAVYEVQTLAAQYYLDIEDKGWNESRCGVTIDIEKNSFIKDVTLETVTTPNVPYPGAAVGDTYLDFCFTLADGSEKHTYIPTKELFDPNVGIDAIEIEYDNINKRNNIKLVINNPKIGGVELPILTQDADGLTVSLATMTDYGVVEYATATEVLTPNSADNKALRPYDLYNFVVNSESVKPDLSNLYTDPDSGEIVNDTVIAAINEIATVKMEERSSSVISEDNIAEYQFETIPVTGVKRQLGDAIEIPKSIVEVESLDGVTLPKDYLLYYLTEVEGDRQPGLYKYVNNSWAKIGGGAIQYIEKFEDVTAPEEDHFYAIMSTDVIVGRYSVSETSKEAGWYADDGGLHDPFGNTVSWASVLADWSSYYNDEIVSDAHGLIYQIQLEDSSRKFVYGYVEKPLTLYVYKGGEWHQVYEPEVITIQEIDEFLIED